MNRYITIEHYDGRVMAMTSDENWRDELEEAADWVWQMAESKEHAVNQHVKKHSEWQDDVNSGKTPKETY